MHSISLVNWLLGVYHKTKFELFTCNPIDKGPNSPGCDLKKIICLSNFLSILFKTSISGDLEPRRARPIPVGVLIAGDVAICEVGNLR